MLPSTTDPDQGGDNSLLSTRARPRWTSVSTVTLSLLVVAAASLRFLFLVQKPFWFDECFSVEVARLSWHDFGRLLWRREANMSLYYLMLCEWLHFGSSPFFIRTLSLFFSRASSPAVFGLASKVFDRRVGLIAVALLSCNAYSIRYAQEARSYSLFVFLAALSSGFFVAALQEPSRRRRVGYVLASILAVYAHLYTLLLLGAQWLSLRRTTASRSFRGAWIWIGVTSLPLVVFAAKTGAGPIRWIQRPGLHDLLDFGERLSGNDGAVLLLLYAAACLAAIVPLKGSAQFFRGDARWEVWRLRFLLSWLILPVAFTLLLSMARPIFLGRYFNFCLPALVILAASGLASLRSKLLLGAILAAMLLLSLQGTFSYYAHDFDLERDGSKAATDYILDHAQAGDAILFHIAETRVPYEFFKSIRGVGPSSGPETVYPRHGERLDYRDFTGKPTEELIQSLAGHYSRVWVVLMSNGDPGHPDATTLMLNSLFGKSFPRMEHSWFPKIEVRPYSGTWPPEAR